MAKSNRLFFAVFNIIHEQNQNNKAISLDLSNKDVINDLNIGDANIKGGQATIDGSGNITSEMKIDNFTCTISGNTEEISCS